jgi:hypothetical protein
MLCVRGSLNLIFAALLQTTIISRTEAIFLKSVTTGKDRHTGEYIVDSLNETIKEVGPRNIVAVTTNNASNIKSSWKGVQKEYPEILCLGYSSYITNLLVKDIIKVPTLYKHFEVIKEVN